MRFIGIFKHGRCEGIAATDAEAHAAIEAHPKLARAAVDHLNARSLAQGTGAPPPRADEGAFGDTGHIRDVTAEVLACRAAMGDTRAAYVQRQQEMARAALERDHLGASRAALRALRVTDFIQPERAETLLAQLRDARTAPDELRDAMVSLASLLAADAGPDD
jgi:hypothetical protein